MSLLSKINDLNTDSQNKDIEYNEKISSLEITINNMMNSNYQSSYKKDGMLKEREELIVEIDSIVINRDQEIENLKNGYENQINLLKLNLESKDQEINNILLNHKKH